MVITPSVPVGSNRIHSYECSPKIIVPIPDATYPCTKVIFLHAQLIDIPIYMAR